MAFLFVDRWSDEGAVSELVWVERLLLVVSHFGL